MVNFGKCHLPPWSVRRLVGFLKLYTHMEFFDLWPESWIWLIVLNRTQNIDSRGNALIRIFFQRIQETWAITFLSLWWYIFITNDKNWTQIVFISNREFIDLCSWKIWGDNAYYNWIKVSNGAIRNQCLTIFQLCFSIFISQADFPQVLEKEVSSNSRLIFFQLSNSFWNRVSLSQWSQP